MPALKTLVILCVVGLLAGCQWFLPAEGDLGQACSSRGACLAGLACRDGLCVAAEASDGDSDTPEIETKDQDESELEREGEESVEGDAEPAETDGEPDEDALEQEEAPPEDGDRDVEADEAEVEDEVEAEPEEIEYDFSEGQAATFVTIKADTFSMGSPPAEAGRGDDEAAHFVTLTRDFVLATTEVTQWQFISLMGYLDSNGYATYRADAPMAQVNWHEAAAFCNALSLSDGLTPCYSCQGSQESVSCARVPEFDPFQGCLGWRLPTEAEWEFAARATAQTAFGSGLDSDAQHLACEVPFALTDYAWYGANAQNHSWPVAQKAANLWEVFDLAGNVAEWVDDTYGAYSTSAQSDPAGPKSGSFKVVRGGGFADDAAACRSAARLFYVSTFRYDALGFRVLRSLAATTGRK